MRFVADRGRVWLARRGQAERGPCSFESAQKIVKMQSMCACLGKRVEYAMMSDHERSKKQSQNGIVSFDESGDVPVYNLNKFLDFHDLSECVFHVVKLHCECCEYKVLPDSRIWLTDR